MSTETETKTKHTPGPWWTNFDEDTGAFEIRMGTAVPQRDGKPTDDGCGLLPSSGYETQHLIEFDPCLYPADGEQFEECEANFDLMAAAPDLLAACEMLMRAHESESLIAHDDAVRMARAAIKKAVQP